MRIVQIGPSILTADLLDLGSELRIAEEAGVDFIHLDIMDGHFVPNMTFGPLMVDTVRRATSLPIDVHLMIENPERFVDAFAEAGANAITVHVEASRHVHALLTSIRERGVRSGLALNPATPLTQIEEALPFCDQILVMTVNPGLGGQTYIPEMLSKIERLNAMIEDRGLHCAIEVDGGIKSENIARVVAAGATLIVAGSAIFADDVSVEVAVRSLREGLNQQGF